MNDKQKELLHRQLNIIGEVAECVKGGEALVTVEICSGGSRKASKPGLIPAIFLDADDAIISWRVHLSAYLRSTRVAQFKFLESPRLEQLKITEADRGMMQRIVADRFGMVSTIGVVAYKPADPPAPAEPDATKSVTFVSDPVNLQNVTTDPAPVTSNDAPQQG